MADNPLFPWLLLDPECDEWSHDPTDDMIEALEAVRTGFSVLMGELDWNLIEERARSGQLRTMSLLHEALVESDVWRVGLSIDEPEEMLSQTGSMQPEQALLGVTRSELGSVLRDRACVIHNSARDLLTSAVYRRMLRGSIRPFDVNTSRTRLWRDVVEPFCRTRNLNIYETYLFRPLAEPGKNLESTGVFWLLTKLSERAAEDGRRQVVCIRGSYRDRGGRDGSQDHKAAVRLIESRIREIVDRFSGWLDLTVELIDREGARRDRGAPHDRFWLGRNGNSACRALQPTTSIIQQAQKDHRYSEPFTVTVATDDATVGHLSREWLRSRDYVLVSSSSVC